LTAFLQTFKVLPSQASLARELSASPRTVPTREARRAGERSEESEKGEIVDAQTGTPHWIVEL
jgi:hypothetical protein